MAVDRLRRLHPRSTISSSRKGEGCFLTAPRSRASRRRRNSRDSRRQAKAARLGALRSASICRCRVRSLRSHRRTQHAGKNPGPASRVHSPPSTPSGSRQLSPTRWPRLVIRPKIGNLNAASVPEIEQAISQLAAEKLSRFAEWFEEFMADEWDKQIERDVAAGKFDKMNARRMRIKAGRYSVCETFRFREFLAALRNLAGRNQAIGRQEFQVTEC